MHLFEDIFISLSPIGINSLTEYNNYIAQRWNNVVKSSDTVYILGDIGKQCDELKTFVKRLKGKKILISGNHDLFINSNNCTGYGISGVLPQLFISDSNYTLFLRHKPQNNALEMYGDNVYHLYGHIHNDTTAKILTVKNAINVCASMNDFIPQTIDNLLQKAKTTKNKSRKKPQNHKRPKEKCTHPDYIKLVENSKEMKKELSITKNRLYQTLSENENLRCEIEILRGNIRT